MNDTLLYHMDESVIQEIKNCKTKKELLEILKKYMYQINNLTGQENDINYMAYYFEHYLHLKFN